MRPIARAAKRRNQNDNAALKKQSWRKKVEDLDAELNGVGKELKEKEEDLANLLMQRVGAVCVRTSEENTLRDDGGFKVVTLPGSISNSDQVRMEAAQIWFQAERQSAELRFANEKLRTQITLWTQLNAHSKKKLRDLSWEQVLMEEHLAEAEVEEEALKAKCDCPRKKKQSLAMRTAILNLATHYSRLRRVNIGRAGGDISALEEQLLMVRFFSPKLETIAVRCEAHSADRNDGMAIANKAYERFQAQEREELRKIDIKKKNFMKEENERRIKSVDEPPTA